MTTESLKSRIAGYAEDALVFAIFAAIALPGLFRNAMFTENYDEGKYHLPAIRRFASELPYPNLTTYSSATTPLYHLMFAILMRIGCGLTSLRLINFAISAATVLIVMAYLRSASHDRDSWLPCSTTLLFASSIYVVGPSIRLTTDNLALGSAVAILFVLDRSEDRSDWSFAAAVLIAIIAILTRQLYLWLVPMLGLYALTNEEWDGSRKLIAAGAATLPLLAALPFLILWHGVTNANFAPQHELHYGIINGKALVLAVCSLGIFAVIFAPAMVRVLVPDTRGRLLLAGVFVLAAAVLPALGAYTGSYRVPMEGGWLRAVAQYTPAVFNIWSLFWILFPVGCVVIGAMTYHAATPKQEVWILIALVLWLLADTMQGRAMAKYYEPFEIVVIGRLAVSAPSRWWDKIPVWMLAAIFMVVDIFRFWFGAAWASPGFS